MRMKPEVKNPPMPTAAASKPASAARGSMGARLLWACILGCAGFCHALAVYDDVQIETWTYPITDWNMSVLNQASTAAGTP
jgi:hypothetical protein